MLTIRFNTGIVTLRGSVPHLSKAVRPPLETQCSFEIRYELTNLSEPLCIAGFHSCFNTRKNESARLSEVESHELPYGTVLRGGGDLHGLRIRVNLAGARLEGGSQGRLCSNTMYTFNIEPLSE